MSRQHPIPALTAAPKGFAGLPVLAALILFTLFYAISPGVGPAVAQEVSGSARLTLGSGKAGSSLVRQKVRFSARSGATWRSLRGGRIRTSHPVSKLGIGSGADLGVRGVIQFTRGKRKATAGNFRLRLRPGGGSVRANLGKKKVKLFTVSGPVAIDPEAGTVGVKGRTLSLTGKAAGVLRKRLGLKRLKAGPVGSLGIDGRIIPVDPPPTELDPYFDRCGLSATGEATGDLPAFKDLPAITDPLDVVGNGVSWGIRESFRNYVGFGGSIFGLEGATAVTVAPSPAVQGFDFSHAPGSYSANDPADLTDDQAIVNGTGTALFCKAGNFFRIAISNPTVVIDGEDSRIIADVDTNFRGTWTPAQRIDFATLDLDAITPFYNRSGAEVTWSDVPVTLTDAGSQAFCDPEGSCFYQAGEQLDPITVEAVMSYPVPPDFPAPTSDSFTALANYVATELPFPLSDNEAGGCTLPINPDTTPFRTIDEDVLLNTAGSFKPVWKGVPGNPDALPALTETRDLEGGVVEWGFRGSLRGSLNASGAFNLSPGMTASNTPYYGFGEGALAPASPRNGTDNPLGQMGNVAGRHFKWPASGGSYQARQSGGDRLIIEGSGRVAFCQIAANQWYGVVFSDPTVVIDGANSRITMDVATRYRYSWVRGRVDIATLNLGDPGVTASAVVENGEKTVSWSFPAATGNPAAGPVTLTADGEQVVNMLSSAQYTAGLGLDGLTVRAKVPVE
jgi:hypothetical protein